MPDDTPRVIPFDTVLDSRPPSRRSPWSLAVLAVVVVSAVGWITRAPDPPATWEVVEAPDGSINIETLIATADGFAVASGADRSDAVVWTSLDGYTWDQIGISRAPTRIVADGDDLVGYDARTAFRISDGSIAEIALPELLRTGYGSGRSGLVPGRRGLIAHTVMGDVYRSFRDQPFVLTINADRWRTATDITLGSRCSPPERTGPDLPPVVVTDGGFHAFVAADDASGVWPICEPIPWTSGDGSIWKQESADSPFGVGAYITDLDATDDFFVAVGGTGADEPHVWISDDGLDWERTTAPTARRPYELIEVEGGPAGWIAIGKWSDRPGYVGWMSTNGTDWRPLPDDVPGRTVAVGETIILIGDRSDPTSFWRGSTGSRADRADG